MNGDDFKLVSPTSLASSDPSTRSPNGCSRPSTARSRVESVVFVLSARERIGAGDRFIASRVFALGVPVVIALNKVDRLKPGHIASQMNSAAKLGAFHALHPVSAKTGDGIAELRDELVALLPEGPLTSPGSSARIFRSSFSWPSWSARRRSG